MTSSKDQSVQGILELLDRYELYAKAAGFSNAQISHMRRCVGYFDRFLGGITDAAAVKPDDFRLFLADLRTRHVWQGLKTEQPKLLSGTSINTYARAIKTFYSWMTEQGIISANPLAPVTIPKKPKTLPKVYTEQELRAFLAAAEANIRDNAIVSFFIDSGIRLGELAGIKMGNLDIDEGWVKVIGKGRKERIVPFQSDAAQCLKLYIAAKRQNAGKDDFYF